MFDKNVKKVIAEYFQIIFIFLIVFAIIYFFVGQLFEVVGNSMLPTFQDKEQLVAEKISINTSNMKRGDVIIFKNINENNRLLIKRIVGLPEESIRIQDGKVFINEEELSEDYLKDDTVTIGKRVLEEGLEYKIPEDSYVVMGDNREESNDSREWGYVKKENIVGKVVLVYYPLQNFRFIK
jgi:signal peptidase I